MSDETHGTLSDEEQVVLTLLTKLVEQGEACRGWTWFRDEDVRWSFRGGVPNLVNLYNVTAVRRILETLAKRGVIERRLLKARVRFTLPGRGRTSDDYRRIDAPVYQTGDQVRYRDRDAIVVGFNPQTGQHRVRYSVCEEVFADELNRPSDLQAVLKP